MGAGGIGDGNRTFGDRDGFGFQAGGFDGAGFVAKFELGAIGGLDRVDLDADFGSAADDEELLFLFAGKELAGCRGAFGDDGFPADFDVGGDLELEREAGFGVDGNVPPADKSADGIGVFDVAQGKLVKMLKSGSDPEEFDISQDGKFLYVSNEDAAGVSILDLTTERIIATLPTGEEPEGVEMSPDGKFVYATSEDAGMIYKIDTATRTVVNHLKVGRRPRTVAWMPDGKNVWVNAENDGTVVYVDAVKNEVVETITLGEAGTVKPMAVLLSKDASKLYVSTGRGKKLFVLDTATRKVESSFEVGQRPWSITLSPDGKTLYTANGPSNDLSVVDLATKTVTKKIMLTGSPWGVIVLPRL